MNFLKAKSVSLVKNYLERTVSNQIYTNSETEQQIYVSMAEGLKQFDITVTYGKGYAIPKKLSVSAIQYTMSPLPAEISLIKYGSKKPYLTIPMEGIRTIFDIEPCTNKIVFSFLVDKFEAKTVQLKLSINYIKF